MIQNLKNSQYWHLTVWVEYHQFESSKFDNEASCIPCMAMKLGPRAKLGRPVPSLEMPLVNSNCVYIPFARYFCV